MLAPLPEIHACTRDWAGHHPLLCDLNMMAAHPVYEAMGCEGIKVRRMSCVVTGAPECRSIVTWTRRQA